MTPAMLVAAGVRIAFQTGGITNVDGLLSEARSAFAAGLTHEAALVALTLGPARIFGGGEELGSLEVGKIANVVVFNGDPLTSPATVERVFVRGDEVVGPGG